MAFYDMLIMMDRENRITGFELAGERLSDIYRRLLEANTGSAIISLIPDLEGKIPGPAEQNKEMAAGDTGPAEGEILWEKEHLLWKYVRFPDMSLLFLQEAGNREFLMESTLDQITQGIQIYDRNGNAVYFNPATRAISGIPENMEVEGRHLLDLYDEDEEISTILTAIRTGLPVKNRVDHFRLNTGKELATVNTAYPLYRGKELAGAVSVDMDRQYVQSEIKRLREAEDAFSRYLEQGEEIRFSGYTFEHIIGRGLAHTVALAKKAAAGEGNVLLVGETGTGKEIFAQSIHRESRRRRGRFVALNCAAVPDTLIESILFGTVKGSFTGSENRTGYLEQADGGTLFLDELNSMSLAMQSRLLRVLQEQVFRRVGGEKDIHVNARIIASCNEDPFSAIAENRIRRDLFYRISTVMIEIPPLRERKGDLEELIPFHLRTNARKFLNPLRIISPEAMALFRAYAWPGNVRELFHVLDYAQNVADGEELLTEYLPPYLVRDKNAKKGRSDSGAPGFSASASSPESFDFSRNTLQDIMDACEHRALLAALEHYGYNITKTADALGIRRQSLQYRIKKYGIQI